MVRQQDALDVVGVIDDVVIDAPARCEDPIEVAELREIASLPPRSKPSAGPGGNAMACIGIL
jgi:hypothetical protein